MRGKRRFGGHGHDAAADSNGVGSLIRVVAILISTIVLLGFAFFAVDEMDRGSQNQQNALDNELRGRADDAVPVAPSPAEEALRERQNSGVREAVDDANDVLLAPFGELINSTNAWVMHGIPTLMALLLYGLGFGMAARMLPKHRDHSGDWRAPA